MRRLKLLGGLILALIAPARSEAQATPCVGTQAVYFGNGVWVPDQDAARRSMSDMEALVRTALPATENGTTCFDVAYNRSLGRFEDILETARGILGNEYPQLLIGHILHLVGIPRLLIPNALEQQLNDALRSEAARQMIQGTTSATDVADHVAQYRTSITGGGSVVLVSHSQGNLFANLSYDGLTPGEQSHFAMVDIRLIDHLVVGKGSVTSMRARGWE